MDLLFWLPFLSQLDLGSDAIFPPVCCARPPLPLGRFLCPLPPSERSIVTFKNSYCLSLLLSFRLFLSLSCSLSSSHTHENLVIYRQTIFSRKDRYCGTPLWVFSSLYIYCLTPSYHQHWLKWRNAVKESQPLCYGLFTPANSQPLQNGHGLSTRVILFGSNMLVRGTFNVVVFFIFFIENVTVSAGRNWFSSPVTCVYGALLVTTLHSKHAGSGGLWWCQALGQLAM